MGIGRLAGWAGSYTAAWAARFLAGQMCAQHLGAECAQGAAGGQGMQPQWHDMQHGMRLVSVDASTMAPNPLAQMLRCHLVNLPALLSRPRTQKARNARSPALAWGSLPRRSSQLSCALIPIPSATISLSSITFCCTSCCATVLGDARGTEIA